MVALVLVASAAAVIAWKSSEQVRTSATELANRVVSLGRQDSTESCEVDSDPPATGPVRLPMCKGDAGEADPWLAAGAHGPTLNVIAQLEAENEPRRWVWEDVNTVPIVRWEGDSRIVKSGARGRQYAVRGKVDRARALAMERAFGYEVENAVIRYRTDAELAAKRDSLDRVLADHGVVRQRSEEGDVLAPDYEWMIQASVKDVQPIARAIVAEARRRGAEGLREEFGALASFVQQLEYGESPNPGDTKHRFGLSMPLWALATNVGDCDTRAVLLVALARSIDLCEVELVRDAQHQHMLAAAAIPVKKGDHVVRPRGRALVLVETTDDWPVGRVARRTNQETLQTLFLASAAPASDREGGSAQRTTQRTPQRASAAQVRRRTPQ